MTELEMAVATRSWVDREYRRGLSTHSFGALVLRICVADVLLPTITTRGRPVRKSRTQLHRVGFLTQGPELNDELKGPYGVEG